jgi:hypothetical protein
MACWLIAATMLGSRHLDAEQARQEPQEPMQGISPGAVSTSITTVHGVVRNSVSGEPLTRALVRINGDAMTGALTDDSGRFELPDVPVGPQEFEVMRPGFLDQAVAAAEDSRENTRTFGHNILVSTGMPDVVFSMSPVNSIRGRIELSTGDPAQGIQVTLLRRTVQDGRAEWETASNAKTNSEGTYRFGGLTDGSYALYSEPAMDSDSATNLVDAGRGNNVARSGYASQFYPDARDLAGAAKIRVAGGEQAEANFSLTLEPFQSVTATLSFPGSGNANRAGSESNYSILVLDGLGHQLAYTARYDESSHSIQAFLPDGSYSISVTQTSAVFRVANRSGSSFSAVPAGSQSVSGQVDFTVAGHAVSNLRIPLAIRRRGPVEVGVARNATGRPSQAKDSGIFVTLSQTGGWISDGMISSYAEGSSAAQLETNFTPPGSYWAHTAIAQKGLCVTSLTTGGVDLAREPLVLGTSGPAAPLTLALRDDCATLNLSLSGTMGSPVTGEEPFYTVYAVPDSPSTEDVVPQTLRPSTGGRVTLSGLTPGTYHVYAFERPVALEYRNPAVMAPLTGQAVTLSPGETSDLIVEVGQH